MKLGEQTVIYTLTDSWGARVTKKAIITVQPKNELEQVKFKFYSKGTNNELFNMTIDSVNHKIEVSRVSSNNQAIKGYSGAAFKIKIIDGVRIELEKIKMYESYYVSVWAKDRTKLKISGEITKTENVTEADYLDGISSEDQMLNVRFENTEEGLKAIYNAAPVISLVSESNNSSRIQNTSESIVNLGEFSHYLGETYKLTENMQVTDDKGGEIDVDKITATYEKVVSSGNTNTPETSGNARVTLENGQESTENSSGNNETTGNVKNHFQLK